MATCALCLNEVEKLCQSHILPEPLYRNVYDEKGRFPIFSDGAVGPITKPHQKGLREPLLGECCERRLSRWETHATNSLFNEAHASGVPHEHHMEFKVDYSKFKLFLLSILWRMGASTNQVFGAVQLGVAHMSRLCDMLLSDDPGEPQEYVCLISYLTLTNDKGREVNVGPRPARTAAGHRTYFFVAGGLLWQFVVVGKRLELEPHEMSLDRSGILKIFYEGAIRTDQIMKSLDGVLQKRAQYRGGA